MWNEKKKHLSYQKGLNQRFDLEYDIQKEKQYVPSLIIPKLVEKQSVCNKNVSPLYSKYHPKL
jgi:hypothetical protein